MAIHNGGIVNGGLVYGTQVAAVRFSGTVDVDGVPAERTIIGYNTNFLKKPYVTKSDPTTGAWELTIRMGLSEVARIFCVGENGENSKIFEGVYLNT